MVSHFSLLGVAWSLLRVFGAFVLAAITAIPLGLLMGTGRIVRGIFDPLLEFLSSAAAASVSALDRDLVQG